MFGEKEITGEKEIKIDSKHRITIPKFTMAEQHDIVMPRFSTLSNILFLFSEEEYHINKEKFESFLQEQRTLGNFTMRDILKYRRYYYGHLSFMGEELDKQRRITLEQRAITKLEVTDKMFVVGEEKHLILCKNKDIYYDYLEKKERRGR